MGSAFKASGTERHQREERELRILDPVAVEVELIRKAEIRLYPPVRATGILFMN